MVETSPSWKEFPVHPVTSTPFICADWLLGVACSAVGDCTFEHPNCRLPYSWQYLQSNTWAEFPAEVNGTIESTYCDANAHHVDNKIGNGTIHIDFASMSGTSSLSSERVSVRRLSTKARNDSPASHQLATRWRWYWKDNNGSFTEYSKMINNDLERHVRGTVCPSIYRFSSQGNDYIIDFAAMVQQNTKFQTNRQVRRRPVLISSQQMMSRASDIPDHWPLLAEEETFVLVTSPQTAEVTAKFLASVHETNVVVLSVQDVCNIGCYEMFCSKRRSMERRLGMTSLVTPLYHGTDGDLIDAICHQNFDWRLCGTNGTKFGHGAYFSGTARASHRYSVADASGRRYMFLADVLVGRSALGGPLLRRPPPYKGLELFDSCVNVMNSPTIFVIFERDQYYPRHLITYTTEPSLLVVEPPPQPVTHPPSPQPVTYLPPPQPVTHPPPPPAFPIVLSPQVLDPRTTFWNHSTAAGNRFWRRPLAASPLAAPPPPSLPPHASLPPPPHASVRFSQPVVSTALVQIAVSSSSSAVRTDSDGDIIMGD